MSTTRVPKISLLFLAISLSYPVHESIWIIFGTTVTQKVGNQRYFIFPPHTAFALPGETANQEIACFHLNDACFLGDWLSNGSPYAIAPLSVLPVMLVYCGQMVGWIKMPLAWRQASSQATVRWGPSSPNRAHPPQIFGPCLLWPNGWIDQDATWRGGRPGPRPHCVRWGPSYSLPLFSAHVYWGQTVGWLVGV